LLAVEFLEQIGAFAQRDFSDAAQLLHVDRQRGDGGVAISGGFGRAADGGVLIHVGGGVGVERGQNFQDFRK